MNRLIGNIFAVVLLSTLTSISAFAGDATPATKISLTTVKAYHFSIHVPWYGRVEAISSVVVTAKVSGRVIQIHVPDESPVTSEELLFDLGGKEAETKLASLREQFEQANRSVTIAKQNLAIRKQMFTEKLSNKEQVNAAKQVLTLARMQWATTRQALATMEMAVHINAPVDGVLTGRAVHLGQYVTPGTVLARIINPRRVRIRASLFPPQAMDVAGMIATVHTDTVKNKQAMVSRVMPERTTEGAVQVWIEGDALTGLAPGMQVSGAIEKKHAALAVPEGAIAMDDQGHEFVFIKTAQGWRKQRVETGLHEKGWVEIISGLKESDQIAAEDVYEMLYRDFSKIYRSPD